MLFAYFARLLDPHGAGSGVVAVVAGVAYGSVGAQTHIIGAAALGGFNISGGLAAAYIQGLFVAGKVLLGGVLHCVAVAFHFVPVHGNLLLFGGFGGGGTSRCRPGFATMCISRSAATAFPGESGCATFLSSGA